MEEMTPAEALRKAQEHLVKAERALERPYNHAFGHALDPAQAIRARIEIAKTYAIIAQATLLGDLVTETANR